MCDCTDVASGSPVGAFGNMLNTDSPNKELVFSSLFPFKGSSKGYIVSHCGQAALTLGFKVDIDLLWGPPSY